MKHKGKEILKKLLASRAYRSFDKRYTALLKRNNIENKRVEGEIEWGKKWSVLGKANPVYYRLFSHYIGYDSNILPEDICHYVIEPILNPKAYIPYYADKNVFDKLFKDGTMPKTIFRKMNGLLYDDKYGNLQLKTDDQLRHLLNNINVDKIVVKPSIDTSSGSGVRLFQRKGKDWVEVGGNDHLSIAFLETHYSDDFIVQECLKQADCMGYFNPTSVNTIRMSVYRSINDNKCHCVRAFLRIGAQGALVDNAHAGGCFVGISQNGELGHRVFNQYGKDYYEFNGINFNDKHTIPNWDKIVDFACYIGDNVLHHRFLGLDIMIDNLGNPRLIEYNIKSCGVWAFQFTSGSVFGEFTEEIIEYCKNNLDKAKISFYI